MKKFFRIDAANLVLFAKKMTALSRKAAKLGCAAVGCENLGEGVEFSCTSCGRVSDTLPVCVCTRDNGSPARVRRWRYVQVAVWGEAPKFDGWTFLATLEHLSPGVNLVRSMSDHDLPEKYRSAPRVCDHCNLERRRIDTFVLAHEDGRMVQVGRSCVRDFLGHNSPEHIAEMARFVASLNDAGEDEGWGCGRVSFDEELVKVLAFAIRAVAADGYHPRSKGEGPFTSDVVDAMLNWNPRCSTPQPEPPTEEELSKAADIIAYFASLTPSSDYEHNVCAIARAGFVGLRHYGYAVSLVCAYERAMGREAVRRAERTARAGSNYFGTVGKREVFSLTVTKVLDLDGQYGTTHLTLLVDDAGNIAKWAASSVRLEVGTRYAIKGTVKAHEEYKGTKQTVLSRCAAEPIQNRGAA